MTDDSIFPEHFDRTPKRRAQFIMPPNTLRSKVGYGGLNEDILNKAQALLENNNVEFYPLGEMYLNVLDSSIERAFRTQAEPEQTINALLYPAMQLKANGGMFKYPLVTRIADRLIQFLEVIEAPDTDAVEIVLAFHTTLSAVVQGHISGDGGSYGDDLLKALNSACMRYFSRHPENINEERQKTQPAK